jgi:hypothetical protein
LRGCLDFVFVKVHALDVAALKDFGHSFAGCAVDGYPASAVVFEFGYGLHYASLLLAGESPG